MLKRLIPEINTWITRSIQYPGDSEDIHLLKRIHWVSLHLAIFLVFPLIPLSLILSIPRWTLLGIVYVGFHIIQLIIYYKVRRGVEWFGLATQLFHVILSFTGVMITGGIFNSAGIVFVGLLGPLYALVFPNGRRAIIMLVFYILTVFAEAFLQPFIASYPPITPTINIFMFVIQFLVVVVVNFFTLRFYASQTIKIKQYEALRLKEIDEVKTKIYTNITHEFRTPLTIILGMADQIMKNPHQRLNEALEMIKRNGKNLLHLINQILDLSKIEAKAMHVNYYQAEIISYLRYIFHTFNSLAEDKNINLYFSSQINQLVMDIDSEKMMQIISNLLSNAVKYTPEAGEIHMIIDANKDKGNNELVIKIRDNGIGIPSDKLPYIFNRFYKVEEGSSARSEGTGIGLALTKELVTLLKGTISVQSHPVTGTEFRVTLPITNNSPLSHDIDLERVKSGISFYIPDSTKRLEKEYKDKEETKDLPILLIVEDNTDVIHYLESILYPEYSIRIATNGQEALDLAFEIIPDIIISDVMMPVMDGFILCEKLKTDERTSHIPVILLTAMASDIKKMEGLETGADDYIIKPFNDKELKVRTRNLIEQRRKLREYFSRNISISPKDIAVTSADEKFMIRAMDIIEKSMSNPEFGVNIFGKEIGMSHSQLYRKIHALTNFTPVELIRIMRLKRAASLLKQKYGNISEVAYETGFNSPSYFSDCFQKQFGKSPTEFIENN
jgi:signal transduction histidine kinase/DNA-binding response OmpR family regulator